MSKIKNENSNKELQFKTLEEATGKIPYNMLNDYIFRVVLEKNPEALKNIISAVLHTNPATIKKLTVKNPIKEGEVPTDKSYRFDISIIFNDNSNTDIEMQVLNEDNWTSRSLHYLCREYEQGLIKGDNYNSDHAAYQIGFLNYTLFPEHAKFFSQYEMADIEDGFKFNRNFAIFVIDLGQIEMATKADKDSGLQKWCRLFKAQTYDELRRLSREDKTMSTVANDVFDKNADFATRKLAQDRADYIYWESRKDKKMADLEKANAELIKSNSEKEALIEKLQAELASLKSN